MDQIIKRSNEKFPIYANFQSALADSELIASYTLTCVNILNGANTKATIVNTDLNDDPKVKIIIQSGTKGDQHKITVKVVSSFSQIYEKDLLIVVNDDPVFEFTKQPSEEPSFSLDFTNDMESGDAIAIEVATVFDVNGVNLTSTMILGTISDGEKATTTVTGGTSGQKYLIVVAVTTNNGYVYSKGVLMNVEEF